MSVPDKSSSWVIASHNPGKIRELVELFRDLSIRLRSAPELSLAETEETGDTFEENAALKAVAAAKSSRVTAVADDSGVAVDALDGDPGVHTALWAGPERDFDIARREVNRRLAALGPDVDRHATFVTVLCVAVPDGDITFFRGEAQGRLVWPPRGDLGFGFEPMFLPDGYAITYGEMTPSHRMRVNARAQAMRRLHAAHRHLSSE